MKEIIEHLEKSIKDTYFSKSEAKELEQLIRRNINKEDDLKRLQSHIFNLANKTASSENFNHVMKWLEQANSALTEAFNDQSDVCFSPNGECRNTIADEIDRARKKLDICVFTISDNRLADALITAHRKGVRVRVITDNDKSFDMGSDIEHLNRNGIAVKMDDTSNHMHHKFAIVDDCTLITGSFNWTRSATEFNHENILVTKETGLIKSYSQEFEKLWGEMFSYKK
ncbi:MAG: phospholipase D-like domain-containing protein [Bacteroidota bacterium]